MTVSDDDLTDLLNEELYARRVKALFLSNAGATIAKIAEECKVSTSTVRKDLEIAKRQYLNETTDQRRATQMAIIMDMRKANYPAMMRGDTDAANTILRGLKQEASLFGLFPKVLEVPGIDSVSAANEAAALIERIAQIDPAGLKEITRGQASLDIIDADIVDSPVEPAKGSTPLDAAEPAAVGPAGQPLDPAPEHDSAPPADQPGTAPAGDDRGEGGDGDDWSNIGD